MIEGGRGAWRHLRKFATLAFNRRSTHMALGREAEAHAVAGQHNETFFKWFGKSYSLNRRLKSLRNRPWKDSSWIDVYAERLRRAGIPD